MSLRQPTRVSGGRRSETAFRLLLELSGLGITALLAAIFLSLLLAARPALVHNGLAFLTGTTWDPVADVYGALPFLVGTLLTSFIALAIAMVLSLAVSILLGEYLTRGPFSMVLRSLVELLAGIPSVVYGFVGLAFIVPAVRSVQMALRMPPFGVSILTASLLLSIMILPYAASIGREVIALVPGDLREAALSLGATRSGTVRRVTLPYAMGGILGGMLLALGRALGETMAVTMLIGNSSALTLNLFAPGNTMASVIANEFTEAVGETYLASLVEIGLLLFVTSTALNLGGRIVIKRMARGVGQ
jgi:phosphate transport system permease protein